MNLRIEHLRLRLPHALAPRAGNIAREIAGALGELSAGESGRMAVLAVPPVRVDLAASDKQIGARIAQAIGSMLGGRGTRP